MLIQRCLENKMYRTLCVLALLALCAGLAHSFSWDIVVGVTTLEFYSNEGTLTNSMTPTPNNIFWVTYDPFNNRVLFIKSRTVRELYSYDIATKTTQSLIRLKRPLSLLSLAYDPATDLLFGTSSNVIYSFLVKSGSNNEIDGNLVIDLQKTAEPVDFAVDSCGGYIYWCTFDDSNIIERVRFDGSEREVIMDKSNNIRELLAIDSQAHKIYWVEHQEVFKKYFIMRADMNGKNQRTLYIEDETDDFPGGLTVSNDFIYWLDWYNKICWQLPKNLPRDTDVKPKKIAIVNSDSKTGYNTIAAKYAIEEQTLGIPLCKALKSLLPSNSAKNDPDSLNVPSDVNLICVHGTKVSGETRCECAQGYSGERCEYKISECYNYCLHGDCSVSAEGQPKCRCNAGYSGERCEEDACQGYCINNGDCSLNDDGYPVCRCSGVYAGKRCHYPVFLSKSYEQFDC